MPWLNISIKTTLKKYVSDTGKDWDKCLPFLLSAYMEVPQISTGFLPFECIVPQVTGHPLHTSSNGCLDVLRKI